MPKSETDESRHLESYRGTLEKIQRLLATEQVRTGIEYYFVSDVTGDHANVTIRLTAPKRLSKHGKEIQS